MHGVAATVEHRPLTRLISPRTVIDVGANKGQFTLFALEAWPACRVYAFEPLTEAATRFRAVMNGNRRVMLREVAVGSTSGTAEIHVSGREDSSSLLPIGDRQAELFPGTGEVGIRTIPVARLSEVLDQDRLIEPVLLKIDVQGFELAVLRGSDELLPLVRWLYIECSEIELYNGQSLRPEIEALLLDRGFRVERRLNQVHHNRAGLVQSDLLFARP